MRDRLAPVLDAIAERTLWVADAPGPGTRLKMVTNSWLTAVVEDDRGSLSYWALRHAPGNPDFHDPDAFALELLTS